MKFHLATAHGAFGTYESKVLAHRGSKAGKQPEHMIWPVWRAIQQLGKRLAAALRPIDPDEAYLAQAQNHADLERRIQNLVNPERDPWGWRY